MSSTGRRHARPGMRAASSHASTKMLDQEIALAEAAQAARVRARLADLVRERAQVVEIDGTPTQVVAVDDLDDLLD